MNYTNKFNLPKSLVDAITKNTYDLSTNDTNVISVTGLNNPPKIFQLSKRHWKDIEEDISDNIWRLLGSAVHEVLSRIPDEGRLIEERIFVDLTTDKIITLKPKEKFVPKKGHVYLSGKPDLYDAVEYAIEDYKVTSVWAIKFDKQEWVNQVNLYAWFMEKLVFLVKKAHINAILRDWSALQAAKNPDTYPPIAFKQIEIPLWSTQEQELHIKERIALHQSYKDTPDDEIPYCSEEERWKNDTRCTRYCSANKFCHYWKEKYGQEKVSN